MRLNGWQRLWVVIAALWTPIGVWQSAVLLPMSVQAVAVGFAMWATPLVVLYAAGLTVAWVRRGFTQQVR